MGRESDGIISLTFADLEKSDRGHLLKNRVFMRDCAIVTIEHVQEMICRESDDIIRFTFDDLETSDQGDLHEITVSVRDSTMVTIDH